MSEDNQSYQEKVLSQMKCHFTWKLFEKDSVPDNLECRVLEQINDRNTGFKATLYNLMAYINHCRGQSEAALECLQQAEEHIQREHANQADIKSLVTWGNYAWVYYHMGRVSEAQIYVDKVKQVCDKFSIPYTIECPEMYSEEGWVWLKCGNNCIERAKMCFEKALEMRPNNPEFTTGLAIATYRLDENQPCEDTIESLRQAIELSPENYYVKVLLALTLQKMKREAEGERLVEEALEKAPHATDMIYKVATFYQNKCELDKAIELLKRVLEHIPNNAQMHFTIGSVYETKVLEKAAEKLRMSDEEKQNFRELVEQGLYHFKRSREIKGNHPSACLKIAKLYLQLDDHQKAEKCFEEEFNTAPTPLAKQKLHLLYGYFQYFDLNCEDTSIHHYMEGVKIDQESPEKDKMKKLLEKIAKKRLSVNAADAQALSILEFLQEQNGE